MRIKLKFNAKSSKSKTPSTIYCSAGESCAAALACSDSRKSGSKLPHSKLELAGLLARPALDDDFRFGEEFDGVASLAVKDAEETFFPTAEGEIGHRGGDADVDADISRGRFVAEFARGGTACCEERCLVAVRTAAKKFHGLINGVSVNQAENGAENLCVGKLACGRQSVKDRGGEEIS